MSYFGSSKANAKSQQQAQDVENQNDSQLDDLHSKIRSIRQVTSDIYSDSVGQNGMLDTTSGSFDSLRHSLSNSATRLGRIANKEGSSRTMWYFIGGVCLLFLLYRLFGR